MRYPIYLLLIIIAVTIGCKKSKPVIPTPASASLVSPAQNETCSSGTIISATQTVVTLNWQTTANTNSYELDIKNLLTGVIIAQATTTNQATVTLSRNTPYSWYVLSKATATTNVGQSGTWKFYVAGLSTLSYPPFPATIASPTFGQNITSTDGKVNFAWTGADVDNDIVGYDIYFGTTSSPALLKSNVTDTFYNGVPVTSGATFYWKVITKDSLGNTSDSGVYQFKVN